MDEKNQEIIEKVLAYKLEEHPTLPLPNKRQRMEMIQNIGPEKVLDLFLMRENKIKAELNDPMRYGHELPHWPDADKLLGRYNELVVLGGNRCLAGETVLTDAKTGKKMRLDAIRKPFHVLSIDEQTQQVVVAEAEVPFKKAKADLFEVKTNLGRPVVCSGAHLVMCKDKTWAPISSLTTGSKLFHPIEDLEVVSIEFVRNDFVWDFTVPVYHNYIHATITHHNSGKTEFAAKRMAQAFIGTDLNGQAPEWVKERHGKRNIRIWCLHTTHMTSVSAQQNVFYKYLPPEIRNIKRTNHTQISFSQKNGFSDNTAVYMGNQIWFLNYAQDIKVVEGGEVDYVWCDELVPQNWLETLRYRLVTRSGKLIVTFTPVQGYTQVVKEYINSAKVTASRKSPLLPNNNVLTVPKGEMPYQAENLYGRHACIWYHTELNPYNNWERMKQELSGRSSHDIKIRAYGWADQTAGSEFPMFGDHNLWKGDAEEVIPEGSNYMAIDPAGARNWFMLWARVDKHGILWVYREWPDQSYGEWALPSDKPDGRAGPAQKAGAGRGVNEYTELIWSLETAGDKREMIVDRWIDPRTAGTETITKDGGVTVLDLLSQADNPLIFTPAAALPIEERVLLINDLLSWDREKPMEKGVNHPKLMIHESCQNLIYSLKEWTGQDGQKGASKDPIDALGYMVVMQPAYFGGLDWEKQSKRMSMTGSY
jgi:phage terminase large subunit-like protein